MQATALRVAWQIFGGALSCTFLMYMLLGVTAVTVLGDDVDPSCNLNWSRYRFDAIKLAISLFPAIDCLSVFPMNAIFLANNLLSVAFERSWHAGRVRRRVQYVFRLLCCVPAFICAFAFPSLSNALDFTGVVGIVLPFIITPTLHVFSIRQCWDKWGRERFDRAEAEAGFAVCGISSPWMTIPFALCGVVLLSFMLRYGFE